MATYKDNIFCQTYQKLKMTSTAIHFATVALNTDPVPQPKELTVAQKYAILAEQGSNCQKIKAWVKKNYSFMYGNFETNGWNACPIKSSNLRLWTCRLKKNGCLSNRGQSINTPKEYKHTYVFFKDFICLIRYDSKLNIFKKQYKHFQKLHVFILVISYDSELFTIV